MVAIGELRDTLTIHFYSVLVRGKMDVDTNKLYALISSAILCNILFSSPLCQSSPRLGEDPTKGGFAVKIAIYRALARQGAGTWALSTLLLR